MCKFYASIGGGRAPIADKIIYDNNPHPPEEPNMQMNEPVTQREIDQRVFDLYDEYCHGGIDRREFLLRASVIAGGLAMAQAMFPRYAEAQTISFTDPRIKAQ